MARQRFIVDDQDRGWMERYGWRSAGDVLACSSNSVAAVSQSSDVMYVPMDANQGGPASVFVKRYLYKRRSQRLKQMFRGTLFGKSRARTEYEFLQEMRSRQVPTVRPIAYGEVRKRGFLRKSFLITEGMEGGQSLDMLAMHAHRTRTMSREARIAMTRGLACLVRAMHEAGVLHGGLFWRNILVKTLPGCEYEFALLDPDSRGRLSPSPVASEAALRDLSQFVASAMALGVRGGLRGFMCAYFQVDRLTEEHRRMITHLVEHAGRTASQERHRIAVADAIDWFKDRVIRAKSQPNSIRSYKSIDDFLAGLRSCDVVPKGLTKRKLAFHFEFTDAGQENRKCQCSLLIEDGKATVSSTPASKPDMAIVTDSDTWLAVISGKPEAYAHLRAGRLHLHGDTSLLPILGAVLDELPPS